MVDFVAVDPRQNPNSRIQINEATPTMGSLSGASTYSWPIWYSGAGTAATTNRAYSGTCTTNEPGVPIIGRGAWINTTVATVTCGRAGGYCADGLVRASWVNGYLCLQTINSTTTAAVTVIPEQIAQIGLSPTQLTELNQALRKYSADVAKRFRRQERERQRVARRWEQATKRATRLLRRHLNREQRAMFDAEQRFIVRLPGRAYEITHKHAHNVFALDENGERVQELCVVLREKGCPIPDLMLGQKLWLEHRENDLLRVANITDLRTQHVQLGTGEQVRAA